MVSVHGVHFSVPWMLLGAFAGNVWPGIATKRSSSAEKDRSGA
jgi:hypothetical protein